MSETYKSGIKVPNERDDNPPARILVVDDQPANLLVYDAVLRPLGQPIVQATSGEEALQHVLRESFAVVLMDVMMPGLDGFDTVELMCGRAATRDLPVVFVTACAFDSALASRAYELGAADILYKPIDPFIVKTKVNVFVSLFQRACLIERQQREIAREQARSEAAEAMNRAKDEFLALVSHELRTPLMSISGWADFLRTREPDPRTIRRAAEVISRGTKQQGHLIDDLLDVSRMVTGKFGLNVRDADLVQILEATIESLRPIAAARHIGLRIDSKLTVARGRLDPLRIGQVVTNLVTNALKFSPAGSEVVVALSADTNEVLLRVTDSGVGIAPDFLPHVFERFRQQSERRAGGLGLGLAITKHIVENHGGTIAAFSDGIGKGASFVVRLPLLAATVHDEPIDFVERRTTQVRIVPVAKSGEPRLQGISVLVVEDDVDSRELLELTLLSERADVYTAASVAEALRHLDEHAFDVIVSDLQLGDEDGLSLIRAVRQRTDRNRDVAAIATTGFASNEDRSKTLEAGFATHLSKPYEMDSLVTLIATLAPHSGKPTRLRSTN